MGIFITLMTAVGALWLLLGYHATATLSDIGQIIGGFSAFVAFCWLILGYMAQIHTLDLQRQAIQNSAYAQELASFLTLYDFIHESISADLRDLANQLGIAISEETNAQALSKDSYLRAFLDDDSAVKALESALRERTSVTAPDLARTYIRKVSILRHQLARLPVAPDLYEILLETSPLARLAYVFENILDQHANRRVIPD